MKINPEKIFSFQGHAGAVYTLEKGIEQHQFFSGSSDGFVVLWNLKTMEQENFIARLPASVFSLCYVKEKNLLLVGTSTGNIHVIDMQTKQEIKILQLHSSYIFDIKYSADTNCFYTAGGDGQVCVCSLKSLSLIKKLNISSNKVRSIAINNIDPTIALYPKIGLRELVAIISDVIPKAGNNTMYTSGWPKNQNKC